VGRSKGDLLSEAEFDHDGKLRRVEFDWLKKGNRKISSWDNTILGSIKISRDSLVAEVNSEKRATRLHAEIEKRLGSSAVHQSTRTDSGGDAEKLPQTKDFSGEARQRGG
jgi:hypothetical protein